MHLNKIASWILLSAAFVKGDSHGRLLTTAQVNTFPELVAAVEVDEIDEITIIANKIVFERAIQVRSGKPVSIIGTNQGNGQPPILVGSISEVLIDASVPGTTLSLSQLELQLPNSWNSPNSHTPTTSLFALDTEASLETTDVTYASGLCAGWAYVNGKCISEISQTPVTWEDADVACVAANSHLVSVHDDAMNAHLAAIVQSSPEKSVWIGASFNTVNNQQQWSDGSDPSMYSWPITLGASKGRCVALNSQTGGMWERHECSGPTLKHYVCAVDVNNAPSLDHVLKSNNAKVSHTNLRMKAFTIAEVQQVHALTLTNVGPKFASIQYAESTSVNRIVPVPNETPFVMQVQVIGTGLSDDVQVYTDDSSVASTPATISTDFVTFDLTVTRIPTYIHVAAGSSQISIAKVQLILQGKVAVSKDISAENSCFGDAVLGEINPFVMDSNNELVIKPNRAASLGLLKSGCSMFSLWTPPSKSSPVQLRIEGIDVEFLQVSDSNIKNIDVPANGILNLEYMSSRFRPTFTLSRTDVLTPCVKHITLYFYDDVIGTVSAKTLFETCSNVCGAIYQTTEECLRFDSNDNLIDSATFDLSTMNTCDKLAAASLTPLKSIVQGCTYSGPFTQQKLNEVFGESEFSKFQFTSDLPPVLSFPSVAIIAKNKELILDGDLQTANETTLIQVPYLKVEGTVTLESAHLTHGIDVVGDGLLFLSDVSVAGEMEVQSTGTVSIYGGSIALGSISPIKLTGSSTLSLFGTAVPGGTNQAQHLVQVNDVSSVSVTNLVIENPEVDITDDESKLSFATAERSYSMAQCSRESSAVPITELDQQGEMATFKACQKTCDDSEFCTGVGIVANPDSSNIETQLLCSHCTEPNCAIQCGDEDEVVLFFEANTATGFVQVEACFATNTNTALVMKQIPISTSTRADAVRKCVSYCNIYKGCGSVTVSDPQSPYRCELYAVDEVHTECESFREIHVRYSVLRPEYIPVTLRNSRVEVVAKLDVGLYSQLDCVEYCGIHESCDMVVHNEVTGVCTLVSATPQTGSWSTPSYSQDQQLLVPIGSKFPKVSYVTMHTGFTVIRQDDDLLEWSGRVSKIKNCEESCSASPYCVAFAFTDPSNVSNQIANCFLYNTVGASQSISSNSNEKTFALHVAVSAIGYNNMVPPLDLNCDGFISKSLNVLEITEVVQRDDCAAMCYARNCDFFEFEYSNSTCTIFPDATIADNEVICDRFERITNEVLFYFSEKNPIDSSVRYAKATSPCLEKTVITPSFWDNFDTLESCKVMCDLHSSCTAFIFDESKSVGKCQLISTLVAKAENKCVVNEPQEFYLASHNPQRDAYTKVPFDACFIVGREHEGATLIEASTVSECQKHCFEDFRCRAYSFDESVPEGTPRCVLHDDATMDVSADCNSPVAFVETFEKYFAASSSDANSTTHGVEELLATSIAVSLKECQALCDVFESCIAIAIDSLFADGTLLNAESDCVLLQTSSVQPEDPATYTTQSGKVLSVMNAYDPYLFTEVTELNVYPDPSNAIHLFDDNRDLVVPRQSDCEALCEVVAGCNSLTFDVSVANYGQCKMYKKGSWTEAEYNGDTTRSPTLKFLVSFARFVNPKPEFATFNDDGNLFPSNLPFHVATNVTSATACEQNCLETKEHCEFARFSTDTRECYLYPEGTRLDDEGTLGDLCQVIHVRSGTQPVTFSEVSVLDARGVVMPVIDPSLKGVDGSLSTTVTSSVWSYDFCTPRPIHSVNVQSSTPLSAKVGIYASPPRDSLLGITANSEVKKFIGYANSLAKFDIFSFKTSVPSHYYQKFKSCVGMGSDLFSLRPLLPSGCAKKCDELNSCMAFNYDATTGTCFFKNNAIVDEEKNCGNLNSFTPIDAAAEPIFQGAQVDEGCSEVRIELDGSHDTFLQLCEVDVLNSAGDVMFDPNAQIHATSSDGRASYRNIFGPEKAVDGMRNTNHDMGECYHSQNIPRGTTKYWSTVFCTPDPIHTVRVSTRSESPARIIERINGTRVYVKDAQGMQTQIGVIQRISNEHVWQMDVPTAPSTPTGCEVIRVEVSHLSNTGGNGVLQICELRVFDIHGLEMIDPNAKSRASSSPNPTPKVTFPFRALDGVYGSAGTAGPSSQSSCFQVDVPYGSVGWWESTFCTQNPIANVQLNSWADNEENVKNNLVGATVYKIDSNGVRSVVNSIEDSSTARATTDGFALAPLPHTKSARQKDLQCNTIRIDLARLRTYAFLQLCEVQVFDEEGVLMFDPEAPATSSSSSSRPSLYTSDKVVDGNSNQGLGTAPCFTSARIAYRGIGWWESQICTPRRIHRIKVLARMDVHAYYINGAIVHIADSRGYGTVVGTLFGVSPTNTWDLQVPREENWTPPGCETVRIEHTNFRPSFDICEVYVLDEHGRYMFDATVRSSASGLSESNPAPKKAVDGNGDTCFRTVGNEVATWWEATFCVPRPIQSISVLGDNSDINGAHVSIRNSRGIRKEVGIIRNIALLDDSLFATLETEGEYCNTVRVELNGGSEKYLQLCEIRVYDEKGGQLFDSQSSGQATASSWYRDYVPSLAVDGNRNQHLTIGNSCFHSALIGEGEVGFWQKKFCTSHPIRNVRVSTRDDAAAWVLNRINGAQVSVMSASGSIVGFQELERGINSVTEWNVAVEAEPKYCDTVRIELSRNKGAQSFLQLCSVDMLDESGNVMFDSNAAGRAVASSTYRHFGPASAVDGDSSTDMNAGHCFHSTVAPAYDYVFWESTICTPKPSDKIRILTRTDSIIEVNSRINGAKVFHSRSHMPMQYVGDLQTDNGRQLEWELRIPRPSYGTHCQAVRIEARDNPLRLCEVQLLDETGSVIFDPNAIDRVRASRAHNGIWLPHTAVDGNVGTVMEESPYCYHSQYQSGKISRWETTFCARKLASSIRITTVTGSQEAEIRGAKVMYQLPDQPMQEIGFVQETVNGIAEFSVVPDVAEESYCRLVRVESEKSSLSKLCNVQLLDKFGNWMPGTSASWQARSSNYYSQTNEHPEVALGESHNECFVPSDGAWWWEANICTPKPAYSVLIRTDPNSIYVGGRVYTSVNSVVEPLGQLQQHKQSVLGTWMLPISQPDDWLREPSLELGCVGVQITLHNTLQNRSPLRICEVEVLDNDGVVMFDYGAQGRATNTKFGSMRYPSSFVTDGNRQTCFGRDKGNKDGVIGWRTSFCTPRPVAQIRILTDTGRMVDGAEVTMYQLRGGKLVNQPLGTMSNSEDQLFRPRYCSNVRIEHEKGGAIRLCEVQVLNSIGEVLTNYAMHQGTATASQGRYTGLPMDSNLSKLSRDCFLSREINDKNGAYWEASFCTDDPVASVRVLTPSDQTNDLKLQGAKVFISNTHLDAPVLIGTIEHTVDTANEETFSLSVQDLQVAVHECETLLIEHELGHSPLRVSNIQVFDKSGERMFDKFAALHAHSDSVFGDSHKPAVALKSHIGSNMFSSTSYFSTKSHTGRRWLSVKFCLPQPIEKIQLSFEGIRKTNEGAKVSIFRSTGQKVFFGRLSNNNMEEVGWKLFLYPSLHSFQQCEVVQIETSVPPPTNGNIKLYCTDTSGNPTNPRCNGYDVTNLNSIETSNHVWRVVQCNSKLIAQVGISANFATFVTVKYRNPFGNWRTLDHLDFRQTEDRKLLSVPQLYHNAISFTALTSQVHPRNTFVSLEGVTGVPFHVCEIELLGKSGAVLTTTLLSPVRGPFSSPSNVDTFYAVDGDMETCYKSISTHSAVPTLRYMAKTSEVIHSARVVAPDGTLAIGTKLHLTDERGLRQLAFFVDRHGVHSVPIGDGGDTQILLPYSNVEFGQVAEVKLQVGGAELPMSFSFQTKESCAALCGEWYQCLGYTIFTQGHCQLQGGLSFISTSDQVRRRLSSLEKLAEQNGSQRELDEPTLLPTGAPSLYPSHAPSLYPSRSPTQAPTGPSASPTFRPTASPSTPRPTESPTRTVFDGTEFERSLGPFVSIVAKDNLCLPRNEGVLVSGLPLEACSALCDRMNLCMAITWNTEKCHLITARTGIQTRSCDAKVDGESVQLVALSRLTEQKYRMERVGNVHPSDSTHTVAVQVDSSAACESECLSTVTCKFSRFRFGTSSGSCELFNQVGELKNGILGELSKSSIKVESGSYQLLDGHRMKTAHAALLTKIYRKTHFGCMAICDMVQGCTAFNYDKVERFCELLGDLPQDSFMQSTYVFDKISTFAFYRSTYLLRRSRFGGPRDYARLSRPVLRSECESACKSIGEHCDTYIHTETGECRLSSFKSPTLDGVFVNDNGYCIANGVPTLDHDKCLVVKWYFNYGTKDLGRIITAEDGQCVTRQNIGTEENPELSAALAVNDCDEVQVDNVIWTWGDTRFDQLKSSEPNKQDYPKYEVCQDGLKALGECKNERWGLRTHENDPLKYVNVYVTPKALTDARTVTNPDVLYYRWLYSSEGKTARSLLSKAKAMKLASLDIRNGMLFAVKLTKAAKTVTREVQAPLDQFDRKLHGIGGFMNKLGNAARLGEHIPYVKFVAKPMRVVLSNAGGKVIKGTTKVVQNARKVDRVLDPLDKVELQALQGVDVIDSFDGLFDDVSKILVNVGFCASTGEIQEKIVKIEKKMKQAMRGMDQFVQVGNNIKKATQRIGSFVGIMKDNILNPLKAIQNAFQPIAKFLQNFEFIIDVLDYRVCFKIPVIGRVCLPTLREVGQAVGKVFAIIRSIPFVGWVVGICEDILNEVIQAIFGTIQLPLPGIDLNMGFLNTLTDRITAIYDEVVDGVSQLLQVENFIPINMDLSSFQDKLPSLDCNDEDKCTLNPLGITFDKDGLKLPGVDLPTFDYEAIYDVIQDAEDRINSVFERIADDGPPECVEYGEPLTCDFVLKQFGSYGDELVEELGASGCSLNVPVCNQWKVPGFDSNINEVQDLMSSLSNSIKTKISINGNRRRLGTHNWGFEIPLFGVNSLVKGIQNSFNWPNFSWQKNVYYQTVRYKGVKRNDALSYRVYWSDSVVTLIVDDAGNVSFKLLFGQINFQFQGIKTIQRKPDNSMKSARTDNSMKSAIVEMKYQTALNVSKIVKTFVTDQGGVEKLCEGKNIPNYFKKTCKKDIQSAIDRGDRGRNVVNSKNGKVVQEFGLQLYNEMNWCNTTNPIIRQGRQTLYKMFIQGSVGKSCTMELISSTILKQVMLFSRGVRIHPDVRRLWGMGIKFIVENNLHLPSNEGSRLYNTVFKLIFADFSDLLKPLDEEYQVFGAFTPGEYLVDFADLFCMGRARYIHPKKLGYNWHISAGVELSLPLGFAIHITKQTCFVAGKCFESHVCPIALGKHNYETSKKIGESCTCHGECASKHCSELTCQESDSSRFDEDPGSATTTPDGIIIGVFSAVVVGMTVVGVSVLVRRRRLADAGRFDSQAKSFVQDAKSGVANPMFVDSLINDNQVVV